MRAQHASRAPSRREVLGTLGMLTPILLLLIVPSPLGAQAAAKQAGSNANLPIPDAGEGGPVTIHDIAAGSADAEYAANRGLEPGLRVQIDGVVITAGGGGVPLDLTRFQANCCAADAVPFTVRVETPAESEAFGQDQWIEVTGTLVEDGEGVLSVQAEALEQVSPPSDPYAY